MRYGREFEVEVKCTRRSNQMIPVNRRTDKQTNRLLASASTCLQSVVQVVVKLFSDELGVEK